MSDSMKPCPFCGWEADFRESIPAVLCSNTEGCSMADFERRMSPSEWNRRTETSETVMALKAKLEHTEAHLQAALDPSSYWGGGGRQRFEDTSEDE